MGGRRQMCRGPSFWRGPLPFDSTRPILTEGCPCCLYYRPTAHYSSLQLRTRVGRSTMQVGVVELACSLACSLQLRTRLGRSTMQVGVVELNGAARQICIRILVKFSCVVWYRRTYRTVCIASGHRTYFPSQSHHRIGIIASHQPRWRWPPPLRGPAAAAAAA